MAEAEKKARLSGEQTRVAEPVATAQGSILPTTEKPLPPQSSLHPAFYVVYVRLLPENCLTLLTSRQNVDRI